MGRDKLREPIGFAGLACVVALACGGCDFLATSAGGQAVGDAAGDGQGLAPVVWLGGTDDFGEGFVDWATGDARPNINSWGQGAMRHIWVGVRMKNLVPQHVHFKMEFLDDATGTPIAPGPTELTTGFKQHADTWLVYSGMPGFLKEPCKIKDRKLRARLTLTDVNGASASGEAVITPRYAGFCP